MTGSTDIIPVLAAAHFDPGQRRVALEMPAGMTLAGIIGAALPGLPAAETRQLRVTLVTPMGAEVIPAALWGRVRPKAGVRVVIRIVPGKNVVRSILQIVVAVAAIATGAWVAGTLLGLTSGTVAYSLAFAGASLAVTALGQLLINALIPPVKPEDRNAANRYTISGLRNRAEPNGAVPFLCGKLRYAPPYAALPYSEVVGDWQYIRALFHLGEGPIQIDDIRIGETSIAEYTNVEIETREGREGDAPSSLYWRQIAEEAVSVELLRPLPRDELGEVISGAPTVDVPIVRTTGADASAASVILAFPAGLISYDDEGQSHAESVSVRIEHRRVDLDEWQLVTTLKVQAQKLESFFRQYTWDFPTRSRYQVRLTMLTDETTDTQIQRRTSWVALQTLRPEYPLAYPRPLALVAVRIKATHQLSGALDNLSMLASRVCLDYDHVSGIWIERATSSPASLYRYVLQAPCNPKAVSDTSIDLAQLEDWHDFCRLQGLSFNRCFDDTGTSMRDVLSQIAAVGRATPRHDGVRWGVTIDRPQELIIDHLDPQNSSGFRTSRSYIEHPHAFRVRFKDQTNDYKDVERVVRWPGYSGEITITEALDLPGITDPAMIWREARRRQYEAIWRCDSHQATQAGPLRVATRGDKVMLSHYVLDSAQCSARVSEVMGRLIILDQDVEMVAGRIYGIRFRVFAPPVEGTEPDTIGTSVVRTVETARGSGPTLTLSGSGPLPQPGDAILFGPASAESLPMIVRGIERGADNDEILHLVDEAANIDTLLGTDEIPAWSARAGAELPASIVAPGAPHFTSISSVKRITSVRPIDYQLAAATSGIAAATFVLQHRLSGAADWTSITLPVADGGGSISGYHKGDHVELRAQAISASAVQSAWTATITIIVGSGDAAIPAALDDESITITALLGGALIQLATGSDAATTRLQVYRSRSSTLDRTTDAVGSPYAVSPLQSFSIALGDTTRSNLLADGNFDNPAAWAAGAGWSVASGIASHSTGAADSIGQAVATTTGKWYRLAYSVTGRTAGTVTPRLTGGSVRSGAVVTTNSDHGDRIQAVTDNDHIEWLASADFDGALDHALAYLETAACLDQGTHYVWIEPQNANGLPGALSGPFTVLIA